MDELNLALSAQSQKMAVIVSPILHSVFSLSGWADDHPHLPIIESHLWTSGVKNEAARMEMQLPKNSFQRLQHLSLSQPPQFRETPETPAIQRM